MTWNARDIMNKTITKIGPADHGRPMSLEEFWLRWVSEVVIEVVSPRSRTRDCEEKPDEYLRFGVKEYWMVDAEVRELTVLQRSRGRWKKATVSPPGIHRTRLLPGLSFSIENVFKAAGMA
jgi:Putative restriction endonuclease